jgi:GNAT superfamily N-acetyltransferase
VQVGLTRAEDRAGPLADVLGRAFVHEPMMRWPLGPADDKAVDCFTRCFTYFLEQAIPLGLIWDAGDAVGVAAWIPPGRSETWERHPWSHPRILALADDGGRRYEAFWEWVAAHEPAEALWQLDSIAVAPALQGRGTGRALIEAGLAEARADGTGAFLSTGTHANVAKYSRCGFRVYDDADAPGGGPHVWFMRWDP